MRRSQMDLPNYHGPDDRGGTPIRHGWLAVPALTVIPALRYPVGNKVAAPANAVIVAAFLTFVAPFAFLAFYGFEEIPPPPNAGWEWLAGFAWGCAAVCLAVWAWRVRRLMQSAQEKREGQADPIKPVHQMEAGYSWAARATSLPLWLTEIFLVPGAFVAAGLGFCSGPSVDLGVWLVVVGMSLAWIGFDELRHRLQVSGSITDMHVKGAAAGASMGSYTSHTRGTKGGERHMAEDATSATPRGVVMRPEGATGAGWLFAFGSRRKGKRKPPSAPLPSSVSPQPTRGGGGTTYAEPG